MAGLPPLEPGTFSYAPGSGIEVTLGRSDRIIVGTRAFLAEYHVTCESADAGETLGATEIFVARRGVFLGSLLVADAVRPEAAASMQALAASGIQTVLITGDTEGAARLIGRALGVERVYGGLLPEAKVGVLDRLASEGHTVAMVGDGINDAPALVRAAVGVAMGSGTDVARESADIVLLGNDLSKFVETVWIARRARNIIRFNFAGTLAVDIVGVGLAAAGMLNPLVAALIHVTSELTFILNSARLLPRSAPTAAGRPEPAHLPRTATGTSTAA
jgi:Cd2+/Zn2+-exporting ATPase/Cu+-exporting ATPase